MTKKTKKNKVEKHPFAGFVNFYLTKFDKEQVNAMVDEVGWGLAAWAEDLVEAGYAFKFLYDDYAECKAILMIGETTKTYNQGKIMSARHNEFLKCLGILYHQHEVMSSGESWDTADEEIPKFDW